MIGGKLTAKRLCVTCLLSALLYCMVILGCAVLVFDAGLSGTWGHILTCVLGGSCGCVVCTLTTGKKRRRKKLNL
jgi:hypothetical protein